MRNNQEPRMKNKFLKFGLESFKWEERKKEREEKKKKKKKKKKKTGNRKCHAVCTVPFLLGNYMFSEQWSCVFSFYTNLIWLKKVD